jgi:hypothetical protein
MRVISAVSFRMLWYVWEFCHCFLFLCILLYEALMNTDDYDLWDFYNKACVPKTFYVEWTNSAAKFWITYVKWFRIINCYLFSLWIFKKCSIPFKVVKLLFIFKKFLCWENRMLQIVPSMLCWVNLLNCANSNTKCNLKKSKSNNQNLVYTL